ncbi:hypothetical protein PUW25_25260 (plasmid) [Paenibacillus urinalis]|uniref:Uncharacterized protein n=1 Tax=Paenibacillus urinalis TaxID=521520 RepID=A0ABY7XH87_9BACL|nr:hypothetical protein [Paenibacillus urinalis]WDI05119.1 hypothetical protein PUW25_25260 [Paenibacillus urinalis]
MGIEEILMAEGFQAVAPNSRGTWVPVTAFNPVTSPNYAKRDSRQGKVNELVEKINNSQLSAKSIIGQGRYKVMPELYTANNNQARSAIDVFQEFVQRAKNPSSRHNSYVAFDIETMGDRSKNDGSGFGVTEIAAQSFSRQAGGTYKASSKSVFNALLALDNKSATEMKGLIKKIKTDPYSFRKLTSSEQRSVIDLMRYSTSNEGGVSGAILQTNRGVTNISHNQVVNQILRTDGTIDDLKFIQNFEFYLRHINQGFNDLQANGEKDHLGVINRYNKFLHDNRYKYFLSHNGTNFDIPALEQWSKKIGEPILGPKKHIDFLRVIQSSYPNMKGLHTSFGRSFESKPAMGGLGTLQELRRTFGFDQGAAHNAAHDIGEEGLGGVFSRMFNGVSQTIEDAKSLPGIDTFGFNYHPTQLSWSDRQLRKGDRLFSIGGAMAYGNGEFDFQARSEDGSFVADEPDFNRMAVNSKSFYEVQGLRNISDYNEDGTLKTNRLALDLYNPDTKANSFIIREGDDAIQQIENFVQQKFYYWNGLSKDMQREIRIQKERDLARRRYESLTSLSGAGGNSTTRGFEAAKRMYSNAAVYRERLEGKGGHIQNVIDHIEDDPEEARKRLMDNRITHEEMMERMNFNSLPGGRLNETEQRLFFRMAPRLVDELPHYSKAIEAIEEQFPINPDMSDMEARRTRQQRDIAWRLYNQEVNGTIGGDTTERPTQPFEQRGIHYFDRSTARKEQRYLNFETMATARNAIYRQIGSPDDGVDLRKERLGNLITSLQESNVINRKVANKFHEFNRSFAINDSISMMVQDLMDNHDIMQQNLKIKSVGRRAEMQQVSEAVNQQMIQSAIKKTNGVQGFILQQGIANQRVKMDESAVDIFSRLDGVEHASGLRSNNSSAVNHILETYRTTADKMGMHGLQYNLSVNEEGTQARIQIFKSENSASVMEKFLAGESHSKASEIIVPLIQQNGTHVIGNQVLNARSFLVNEGGDTKTISSAEMIARGYTDSFEMRNILNAIRNDEYEEADLMSKRALRNEIETLSGIKRNVLSQNDGYYWANNDSDFLKQSHVSIAPAMIQEWHEQGRINLDRDIREDWLGRALQRGSNIRHATFDDLSPNKAYEMIKEVDDWAASKELNLYAGSVKSENVSRGIWSFKNIQDYHPLGAYSFNGRDNAVQWFNSYNVNEKTRQGLLEAGIKPSYFDSLVTTAAMEERNKANPAQRGVNMKVAYMSQAQLDDRVQQLLADSSVSQSIKKQLSDSMAKARLYEQQAIFTKEIMDAYKVDNHTFIDKGDSFTWNSAFYEDGHLRTTVNPGDLLGVRTVSGVEEKVFYDGNKTGTIFTDYDENRIGIHTEDQPFKFMIEGEKTTDTTVSRELMRYLTGSDDITAIYNPDVGKHKDFGAMMTGQAKLLADHIQGMSPEQQQRAIRAVEESGIGLNWNEDRFLVNSNAGIKTDAFDQLFAHPDINLNNKTSTGLTTAIQEVRASQVENYSRMTDKTGRVVIEFRGDDPIYAGGENAIKGVTWGHREYGVLDNMGAEATKEHMYNRMLETNQANYRAQESRNMITALGAIANPESVEGPTLSVNDFKNLPTSKYGKNEHSLMGTIFDRSHVSQMLGEGMNGEGYWLELPKVGDLEYTYVDKVVGRGADSERRKAIDKIFIPFTAQEGKGGDIHFRELQKNIAKIYERAARIGKNDGVTNYKEAVEAHESLQRSIDGYVNQLVKDVTSSKGQTYSSVFKTNMNESGTGIFKLIDPRTSDAMDGERTYISPEDAKKMGIYEKLSDPDKPFYTMNVRYPTFHDNAMQITRLMMDENIKPGEFHVTALTASLMKADSDGDYDNIVALSDEKIQAEWGRIYNEQQQQRTERMDKLINKFSGDEGARSFELPNLSSEDEFTQFAANDRSELTAKSGKMVIGHASNLNYAMRQQAKTYLGHNEAARQAIYDFGQDLEQKLISSKHGAEEIDSAMDFINTLYRARTDSDWKKVYEFDRQFFLDSESQSTGHEAAIRELQKIHGQDGGLSSPYKKFGTSAGVSVERVGVSGIVDAINDEGGSSNAGLGLIRRLAGVENPEFDKSDSGFRVEPNDPGIFEKAIRRPGGLAGVFSEAFEDMTGGMLGMRANEAVKNAMESVFNGPHGGRNKMILGGSALALTGLIGYNTLSDSEPVTHYNSPIVGAADEAPNYGGGVPAPAMPGLDYSTLPSGGANIQVSAKGNNQNTQDFSRMVNQGMQQSNYQGGKVNMNISHTDNTSKLTRNWYRDKVEEYS